jgi:hypothetical protein
VFQGLPVSGFYSCSQAPILFQFIGNFEQNQYGFPALAILSMPLSDGFRKREALTPSLKATKKITTESTKNTEKLFQPLFPSSASLQKSTRVFLKAC